MGLILDTSIAIAGERRGATVEEVLSPWESSGETEMAPSAVSVVELTHGIARARTEADRRRRIAFTEELFRDVVVYPVTMEIAKLAGRIDGELAAAGQAIAFEDLVIGATALYLGFGVATLNLRHFQRIPGLSVVGLPRI